MLVVCAALLLSSLRNLLASDPGLVADRLVTATIARPRFRYPDDQRRRAFVEDVLARVRDIPGVHRAAAASAVPFGGASYGSVFVIHGRPHQLRNSSSSTASRARTRNAYSVAEVSARTNVTKRIVRKAAA